MSDEHENDNWSDVPTGEPVDLPEPAPEKRVVYVENRIPGARPGDVLTVEWSRLWANHEKAGNIRVVRDEPAPLYPSLPALEYGED